MTIHLVREQRITYDEGGLSEVRNDMYVKVDSDLVDWLRVLDGAKLSTFMFIALREAYVCADQGEPTTIQRIVDGTSYQERAVRYSVDWLLEHEFICEGTPTGTGARTYRPKAFAWFGRNREHLAKFTNPSMDVANCKGLHPMNDDDILSSSSEENHSSCHGSARTVFESLGVEGTNLDILSGDVVSAIAEKWCAWIESKPPRFHAPVAYMVKQLKANPRAEPPPIHQRTERKRQFHAQGDFWDKVQAQKAKQ